MTDTKSRGILMSAPMVAALLAGRKVQTRRLVSIQPADHVDFERYAVEWNRVVKDGAAVQGTPKRLRFNAPSPLPVSAKACRYGLPGDTLYIKEPWSVEFNDDKKPRELDPTTKVYYAYDGKQDGRVRSALYMPRWASRLTLCLTDVRVERVSDITEDDAWAEGCRGYRMDTGLPNGDDEHEVTPEEEYAALWDELNGDKPGCKFADGPWVWVLTFTVQKGGTA